MSRLNTSLENAELICHTNSLARITIAISECISRKHHWLAFAACVFCGGLSVLHSQSIETSPTLQNDPAHPPTTQNWVDTRLYFGLGPADAPTKVVLEATWRAFLDREVTPRFPAGLSVLDVYGQWQSKPAQGQQPVPQRIRSKLLIIDYPNTPENAARVEAIRAAWKRQTGDQSVLKVTQPADVSF